MTAFKGDVANHASHPMAGGRHCGRGRTDSRDPLSLLAGLGASAAILMLVFKDSIMGFVSGVQLSANDMLKVGDWIAMPKYAPTAR